MLKVDLIGNLGKDAEISERNNQVVINFTVAHNEVVGKERVKKTKWINCSIWKKQGDSAQIANYLKKGALVFIEGKPKEGYYRRGEEIITTLSISVDNIQILSSKKENGSSSVDENDDLPF